MQRLLATETIHILPVFSIGYDGNCFLYITETIHEEGTICTKKEEAKLYRRDLAGITHVSVGGANHIRVIVVVLDQNLDIWAPDCK